MLAGNLVGGWQMGRALLVAVERLAAGDDVSFMTAKIATARFYGDHILSKAPGVPRLDRRRRRRHARHAPGIVLNMSRQLPAALRNLRLPVIGSPLFIISNPKLVIAQCQAGIVGSMPWLNARPAELLDEWLAEITETLAAYDKVHPRGAVRAVRRSTRSCTRATTASSTTCRCAPSTRCPS